MKNSIAFFPSPSPSLFLAYNINEMKETYSITSKVLLDFYHFKRIQLEIFGQNLRNIRSQFRLVAAFIQLYDIYIYGIYRKTFSGERYQKAPRRPPFIRVADSFCPEQACTIRGTKRKFVSLCSNTRHPKLSVARNSRASLV